MQAASGITSYAGFDKQKNSRDDNMRFTTKIESANDDGSLDAKEIRHYFLCHSCNQINFDVECGADDKGATVYSCKACGIGLATITPP